MKSHLLCTISKEPLHVIVSKLCARASLWLAQMTVNGEGETIQTVGYTALFGRVFKM